MSNRKGQLSPGLCLVADRLTAAEAYGLAHHRYHVENIKVEPSAYIGGQADDIASLNSGEFGVICDAKHYFTSLDAAARTLSLYRRRGGEPDAITYAPGMDELVLEKIGSTMGKEDDSVGGREFMFGRHTMILCGRMPEEISYETDERVEMLNRQQQIAIMLADLHVSVALCGATADFTTIEYDDRVLWIGAGIRKPEDIDPDRGHSTLKDALDLVDIQLIGSIMGDTDRQRHEFLESVAPHR